MKRKFLEQKSVLNSKIAVTQPALLTSEPKIRNQNKILGSGILITFEGGDGSGKSTQFNRLSKRLELLGLPILACREPGGTKIGESIRRLVKSEKDIAPLSETFLFEAARAHLIETKVKSSLGKNKIVILDRYIDSTIAYQGYGHRTDIEQIITLNRMASGGIKPDLTILLDIDPKIGLQRIKSAHADNQKTNEEYQNSDDSYEQEKFERMPIEFHERVHAGYHELSRERGRWCVIGAHQAQHRVADAIWKRVRRILLDKGIDVANL